MGKDIPLGEYKEAFDKHKQELFQTPPDLWEMGIVLCDKCGNKCSIDYKYCNKCQDHIVVILSKYGKRKRIPDR